MADNHPDQGEIHIEADAAKGGETSGHMRWVLGISLLLTLIALSAIWIIPALMQGDAEEEATLSGTAEAVAEDDSMLSESEAARQIAGEEEPYEVGEPAGAEESR